LNNNYDEAQIYELVNDHKNNEYDRDDENEDCCYASTFAKVLERVMLLKRSIDVFRRCKQSLDNKGLQLSSRNSKSRLKMS